MSEEITPLDRLVAAIERLYEMEAVHIKRGFCITKATPAVASNHMIEEAVELQAAVLFEGRNEQLGEAADLLMVFLHVLRFTDISIQEVIALAQEKLGKTFTTDPELVTALRDGFTRAARAEPPANG
jgi:phosphoribosyl-ATP pyrophosphohydrolase